MWDAQAPHAMERARSWQVRMARWNDIGAPLSTRRVAKTRLLLDEVGDPVVAL
ncbi:hypothetical protein DB30_02245 [Enhygromyxa salina]|uniref:Uncharacterized protein n=1 Tax=Enhygromyxa salina TaxID=215803 RepID=A0A0C1Z312_9BACT|nr:hypothetical protein DB30_02245 [Enhygromyxa salina]